MISTRLLWNCNFELVAITVNSRDVFTELTLFVQKPIAVLNFEPVDVVAGGAILSLVYDETEVK